MRTRKPHTHARGVIATAAVAMTLVLLTACGREADVPTGSSSSAAPIDDTPATGEINVWAFANEGTALESIAAEFEADNPEADVIITPVPNDELPKKVDTAVATGNVPDIVQPSTALSTFLATGGLAPVPEGVMDPDAFFPGAVDAGTIGGVPYAVPWYVTVQALFYRSDIAAAAGVEPPATWDDMVDWTEGLQANGVEVGYAAQFTPVGAWQLLLPLIYQEGGTIIDGDRFTLDSPEVVAAFATFQELFASGAATTDYAPTQPGETETAIVNGEVGSASTGSFFYGYLTQIAEANGQDPGAIAVAELPAGSQNNHSYLGGSGLSVFSEAPNPEAAWKFIRYATQPEVQAEFYAAAGVLPAVVDAWEIGDLSTDPVLAVFRDALDTAVATPPIVTWVEIRTAMSELGEQLARGTMRPDEAAAELQQRAESIGMG